MMEYLLAEKMSAAYYLLLGVMDTLGRPFTPGSPLEKLGFMMQSFRYSSMLAAMVIF